MISKYRDIPYVSKGRDFRGVDCWGLLYLFYKTELGIDIPSFSSDYRNSDRVAYEKMVECSDHFRGWREVEKPQSMDVALFRIGPLFHVGVFVQKGKGTLSIMKNGLVELIDPKEILWKDRLKSWWHYDR